MSWETFPNAPITEAVLDLRVSLPDDVELEHLKGLLSTEDGFPHREELRQLTSNFQVSPDGLASNYAQSIVGSMYLSQDRSRIVQARRNGFTVNHLRPYTTWLSLVQEARMRWPRYVNAARPIEVTRVALRYVNRVLAPTSAKAEDYVNIRVRLGDHLPSVFPHVKFQVGFQDSERDAAVLVNYGVQPVEADGLPLILDIDVFKEVHLDPNGSDIWNILEHLREVKNRVFFAATTEKAKESFR